jgi:hypothetical protein
MRHSAGAEGPLATAVAFSASLAALIALACGTLSGPVADVPAGPPAIAVVPVISDAQVESRAALEAGDLDEVDPLPALHAWAADLPAVLRSIDACTDVLPEAAAPAPLRRRPESRRLLPGVADGSAAVTERRRSRDLLH